jgi:hypothetical protein
MNHFTRPTTHSALMRANISRIERTVRQKMPKSNFRIGTAFTEQAKRAYLLNPKLDTLHANWESVGRGRRSSACRLEWVRLVIFLVAYILPVLRREKGRLFHAVIADKRWQVGPEDLSPDVFNRPRRKLRHALSLLRGSGQLTYVAVYELSAARNLDGSYVFEPHIHVLILTKGAIEDDLKRAFTVRQRKSERGKSKPVRVERVPRSEVGNVLGYLSKMKPQERVQYEDRNGRCNRTTNRMSADYLPLWLSCMSQTPVTQLIQFGGFAGSMTHRFATCEMATMIGEL